MGECLGNRQTQTWFVQCCYCLDWVWNNSSAHRRSPWAQAWSTAVFCVALCWIALCQMSGKHSHTPWVKHCVSDMARHWTFDRFHNRLRTSCLFCVIITYLWGISSYQRAGALSLSPSYATFSVFAYALLGLCGTEIVISVACHCVTDDI